jgi:hypothetical protein
VNLIYKYAPSEDGPDRIGWCPGMCNSYGMMLIPPRIVPADYKPHDDPDQRPGVSDKPKHVFDAGKPFQVVEHSELHEYVRSSLLFRRVLRNELRLDGAGNAIAIEDPAKVLVERDNAGPPPLDEEQIRGESNASWGAIGEAQTKAVMRHASHGGKRGGNSP